MSSLFDSMPDTNWDTFPSSLALHSTSHSQSPMWLGARASLSEMRDHSSAQLKQVSIVCLVGSKCVDSRRCLCRLFSSSTIMFFISSVSTFLLLLSGSKLVELSTFSSPSVTLACNRSWNKMYAAHRTRRGRRLNFGYQREFQQHMNPHGVGFQKIKK